MGLIELLLRDRTELLSEATAALRRCHLPHYETAGVQLARERLETLFDLTVRCIRSRDLSQVVQYADRVARERAEGGYGLHEVQIAFNVLEEAIWRRVIDSLPVDDIAEAIGLISTVHGAGKDQLARTYVELADKRRPIHPDISALLEGRAGG